jgi:heptosyltransferase-2
MRILIVKLGAIGDVVMALSMLPAIRAAHPDAHVTWVVGKTSRPILELVSGISEVIVVDDHALLRGGMAKRLAEVLKLWLRVGARSFDIIATGHADWRYRMLTALSFCGSRRSFAIRGRAGPIPARYHGNEYVRLVTGRDGPESESARLPALARPLPPAPMPGKGGGVVVLAPGGARNILRDDPLRRWPLASYAALARMLTEEGYTVVLVGGAGDIDVKEAFSDMAVVDLIGKTSLPELAAVLSSGTIVVTHDSLPLHLGLLVGASVIALFGPTMPGEKVPLPDSVDASEGRVRVIWGGAHLACRPCYDGRNFHDCSSNECMRGISPKMVLALVRQMIESGRVHGS